MWLSQHTLGNSFPSQWVFIEQLLSVKHTALGAGGGVRAVILNEQQAHFPLLLHMKLVLFHNMEVYNQLIINSEVQSVGA